LFRIDTGSDMSVLKKNLFTINELPITNDNCQLCYPTEEQVPVEGEAVIKVKIEKFSLNLPVYLAEIGMYFESRFLEGSWREFLFPFLKKQ